VNRREDDPQPRPASSYELRHSTAASLITAGGPPFDVADLVATPRPARARYHFGCRCRACRDGGSQ
jgi:hypothetical protein